MGRINSFRIEGWEPGIRAVDLKYGRPTKLTSKNSMFPEWLMRQCAIYVVMGLLIFLAIWSVI